LKKAYRGPAQEHLTVHGIGGTCDFDFVEGQTYLVYARGNKDSLLTDKCTGTHPISEAAEDIRFLENAVNGRPQGLLFGNVFRRMTVSGNLGLYPPRERLQLVEIWVERSG
jgi:hypothetical protein